MKTSFKKIYLPLYLKGSKGFYCERELETEQNCNILTPLLWPSALCLSRSPDAQPEARGLSFLPAFSTTSCHQRVSKHRGPFCRVVAFPTTLLSLTHLTPSNWLPVFTELYNSSIAHSIFGIAIWSSSSENNCHAVHRSLSSGAPVYDCTWGFTLSHIVSQVRLPDFFS